MPTVFYSLFNTVDTNKIPSCFLKIFLNHCQDSVTSKLQKRAWSGTEWQSFIISSSERPSQICKWDFSWFDQITCTQLSARVCLTYFCLAHINEQMSSCSSATGLALRRCIFVKLAFHDAASWDMRCLYVLIPCLTLCIWNLNPCSFDNTSKCKQRDDHCQIIGLNCCSF